MFVRVLLLASVAAGLAGCGGAAPNGAAESASRLLAASVRNDQAAFEAEIDRAAVREDVRRQMTELARATALDVEGGPSEFAIDRMIGPAAVRLVQADTGEALTAAPSAGQLARLMTVVDGGRVCLGDAGRCQLTFAKARGGWRLVGMQAVGLKIAIADAS